MYSIAFSNFAQAYGEGAYSTSTYQDGTTGGTNTATSNGGTLSDTGFNILVIATIACLVIFVALVVRLWRKPKKSIAA